MTIPANLPATTVVLAMPDPTDAVTAEVFTRWVDEDDFVANGTSFATLVVNAPDRIADTVESTINNLKERGFGVTRARGMLQVTSPIPDTAPTTLDDLADSIDPRTAQLTLAKIIAEFSRRAYGWEPRRDPISFIHETVSGVVDENLRPLLHSEIDVVVSYWSTIANSR